MQNACVLEKIQNHAKSIANGEHDTIHPGMPFRFSEACTPHDCVWQGDLGLEIVSSIPKGYVKAKNPSCQIVLGNTEGAKHCLDSLDGIILYHPKEWTEESLQGPCLVLEKERTVLHPKHGHVVIPARFTVLCHYQREWDKELKKERRNKD